MIRPITKIDAIAFLNEDGCKQRFDYVVTQIRGDNLLLVNERLLALVEPNGTIVNAHIASRRKDWKYIHGDLDEGIEYLFERGFEKITASMLLKFPSTINLVKKHGFEEVSRDTERVHLECHSKTQQPQ